MNITNEYPIMVFRKDNEYGKFYSLGLSKKEQDGSYTNGYMPCQFKKDVVIENQTKIYIKKAFLSFYLNKNKGTMPYVFISEYELLEAAMQQGKEKVPQNYKTEYQTNPAISLSDSDLPF